MAQPLEMKTSNNLPTLLSLKYVTVRHGVGRFIIGFINQTKSLTVI